MSCESTAGGHVAGDRAIRCRAGCCATESTKKSPLFRLKGRYFGKTSRFRSGQIDETNTSRTNMPARRHGDAMMLFATGAERMTSSLKRRLNSRDGALSAEPRAGTHEGVVRDGKTAMFGLGETCRWIGQAARPTHCFVSVFTKAFTGRCWPASSAEGTVKFTDRLQDRHRWNVTIPETRKP